MMRIILGIVLLAIAILIGEFIYRRRAGSARLYGDFTQALGATFYFIIAAILVFSGGVWRFVGFLMVILFFAVARTKWDDVRSTNIRRAILGGGK